MALTAHNEDPNKEDVKKHIDKLKKSGSTQSKDKLKTEFNIDADGKSPIVVASTKVIK